MTIQFNRGYIGHKKYKMVLFHQYSLYINQTWFIIFKYDAFDEKIHILIFSGKKRKLRFFREKIPEIRGKPGKMF
jgi:hypothetical protein